MNGIGLDPKILFRSKLIFGIVTLLVLISLTLGIYLGVKTGRFDKIFIAPFRSFWNELNRPEPTPIPTPVLTPLPTLTPTPVPIPTKKPVTQTYVAPAPACIQKNIREGEFASNKCYLEQDFEDLEYYLNRFNSAVFNNDGAVASMRITCSGSDFFKDSCERDKQQKSTAESDISKYRSIIQGIIAKGK